MNIRSAYDGTRVPVQVNSGPSRTKQSFADECNINNIMAKYQRTGLIEAVNNIQPQYADVVGFDFQFAMDQILQAESMFNQLPSSVRKRFQNSPQAFVEFVGDPANEEEAIRLGLIRKPPEAAPVAPQAPSVPEAPQAPSSAAG